MPRMPRISMPRRTGGFTIAEVVVVIVVIGVIFPIFSALFIAMYRDTIFYQERVGMRATMSQALAYVDESVKGASEFLVDVPSEFTDPYGPNGEGTSGDEAWTYKGDGALSRVLITKSYATTMNPLDSGRTPVFVETPSFSCETQMYYQPELSYVTIFFVKNETLFRRVVTDTTTPLCPGNIQQQKTSCPPTISVGARLAGCEANDEILTSRVVAFSLDYYQNNLDGTSTAIDPEYTSTDPTVLAAADYVMVTLSLSGRNGEVTHAVTQRVTKLNQ